MRTSFAVAAGLAAVAAAGDVTITSCSPTHTNCPYKPESSAWEDWSSTSSPVDPTTTSSSTVSWEDWSTSSSDPAVSTTTTTSTVSWEDWSATSSSAPAASSTSSSYDPSSWADWSSYTTSSSSSTSSTPAVVTSTSSCPMYTATAPPAWFSYLPSDVKSSIAAKWTGAPPADWCYYTYSTSTPAASTTPASSKPVSPASSTPAASSAVWSYSASPVSPTIAAYTGAASSNTGNMVVAGLAAVAAMVLA